MTLSSKDMFLKQSLKLVLQCILWHHFAMSESDITPIEDHALAAGVVSPQGTLAPATPKSVPPTPVREIGGPTGAEPTRFGDWEKAGRCIDF